MLDGVRGNKSEPNIHIAAIRSPPTLAGDLLAQEAEPHSPEHADHRGRCARRDQQKAMSTYPPNEHLST